MNEADTCRQYVVPKLQAVGWDDEPYSMAEQRTITDGRIVPQRQGFIRKPPKRGVRRKVLKARINQNRSQVTRQLRRKLIS